MVARGREKAMPLSRGMFILLLVVGQICVPQFALASQQEDNQAFTTTRGFAEYRIGTRR